VIKTSTQLKAKVRNLSGSDSTKAQTLIRNFIMERFLERISLSEYRDNFILKGGILVASVVGLDTRATMDIDATLDRMKQTIKVDISTGDIITPEAVEYSYHLMFENRSISLLAYNLETLLAEKIK